MNQWLKTIRRGWTVLREHGPVGFLKRTRRYLERVNVSASGIEVSYQTGTRVDFEHRWEILDEAVDQEGGTLLDIGCAEGHLTARFAQRGLLSIGIERQIHTVAAARRNNGDQPRLGFLQYEISPETVDDLPTADVVLLLTVYHHWDNEFGYEDAEKMLATLGEKCDTLIVEIPAKEMDRPQLSEEPPDSRVEYWELLFESVYDGAVAVEFLGRTEYKGEERNDLLFALEFDETA